MPCRLWNVTCLACGGDDVHGPLQKDVFDRLVSGEACPVISNLIKLVSTVGLNVTHTYTVYIHCIHINQGLQHARGNEISEGKS